MMKKATWGSLSLFLMATVAWAGPVTFTTFVTTSSLDAVVGQSGVIGFAYAGDEFVGSLYSGTNNLQLYSTNLTGGNVQKFGAPIPNSFSGEVVVTASLGQDGFASGNIFAGAGTQIYQFSNNGSTQSLFATVPDNSNIRGVLFDPGSSFGGQLIVVTTAGDVYTSNSAGTLTKLASVGEDAEGMDIATSAWGPYAGDLLLASENSGDLRFITPSGNIVATCTGCVPEAEVVSFVPTSIAVNPSSVSGYYEANYGENIQYAAPSEFSTLIGQVIVSSEIDGGPSPVYSIAYSGNPSSPFSTVVQVGTLPVQAEDGIFVTQQKISLLSPEPSSVLMLLSGTLVAGLALRRKLRA